MFFIKTIRLSKKYSNENKIILLFDATISAPCLYPLLYCMGSLRFQSIATQQSDLLAIKTWYDFWFKKYKTIFCESFITSGYDPEIYLSEIDNFIVFLENNKKLENNLIRIRANSDINYMTITQRIRSLFKYFNYLLDEYWNVWNQDLTLKEITNRRKKIDIFLMNKKKVFNKFSKRSFTVKSRINYHFKSLDNEMTCRLYEIIRPNKKANINVNNPFITKKHQLRNFLIVHLMINYGLRVGDGKILFGTEAQLDLDGFYPEVEKHILILE